VIITYFTTFICTYSSTYSWFVND